MGMLSRSLIRILGAIFLGWFTVTSLGAQISPKRAAQGVRGISLAVDDRFDGS